MNNHIALLKKMKEDRCIINKGFNVFTKKIILSIDL